MIALGAFGIPAEAALPGSFYAFFMGYVPVTAVGFAYLAHLGMKLCTLSSEAEAAVDDPESKYSGS